MLARWWRNPGPGRAPGNGRTRRIEYVWNEPTSVPQAIPAERADTSFATGATVSTTGPEPEQNPGKPDLTKRRPAEPAAPGPDPTVAHPIPDPGAAPGFGSADGYGPPTYEPPSGYQPPASDPSGHQGGGYQPPGYQAEPGYQADQSGFGQPAGYGSYPTPGEGFGQPGPQFESGYQAGGYQEPYPGGQEQGYAQAGYPAAGQYQTGGYPTGQPAQGGPPSSLAITALVLSIVGVLTVCWPPLNLPLSVAGVVAGIVNRRKAAQGQAGGLGLSLAAIIVGAISALLGVGALVFYLT